MTAFEQKLGDLERLCLPRALGDDATPRPPNLFEIPRVDLLRPATTSAARPAASVPPPRVAAASAEPAPSQPCVEAAASDPPRQAHLLAFLSSFAFVGGEPGTACRAERARPGWKRLSAQRQVSPPEGEQAFG